MVRIFGGAYPPGVVAALNGAAVPSKPIGDGGGRIPGRRRPRRGAAGRRPPGCGRGPPPAAAAPPAPSAAPPPPSPPPPPLRAHALRGGGGGGIPPLTQPPPPSLLSPKPQESRGGRVRLRMRGGWVEGRACGRAPRGRARRERAAAPGPSPDAPAPPSLPPPATRCSLWRGTPEGRQWFFIPRGQRFRNLCRHGERMRDHGASGNDAQNSV